MNNKEMDQQIANQKRLEEYKAEFIKLSLKYEADVVANPTWIPTDNGFKVGAIIQIIDKQAKAAEQAKPELQHEQIQNLGEEDREEKQGK